MGDGKRHETMEAQTDITCEACHLPRFFRVEERDSQAFKLAFLNRKIPDVLGKKVARTKKGTPIYNLQEQGDKIVFYRKRDGRAMETGKGPETQPHHSLRGHERLSCQACHSAWMPQCYGCHVTLRMGGVQRDWLSGKSTPGLWKESRSYVRFARPILGLKDADTISPFSPCQVFVSCFDEENVYLPDRSFKVFTMSSFDPHTTMKGSRTCIECHGDPKSMGLGEGRLSYDKGKPSFRATYDSSASGLGVGFPLDAFTDLEGRTLHKTSREASRAFSKTELANILRVNACLGCHDRYGDRIYADFRSSFRTFLLRNDLPCRR
jgi:hypothetical protein